MSDAERDFETFAAVESEEIDKSLEDLVATNLRLTESEDIEESVATLDRKIMRTVASTVTDVSWDVLSTPPALEAESELKDISDVVLLIGVDLMAISKLALRSEVERT